MDRSSKRSSDRNPSGHGHGRSRQRPLALGTVVMMLASMAVVGTSSVAQAQDGPVPGIDLPVPALDVTESDADLGSVAREVVVSVTGEDGAPVVHKLRARTQAEAIRLATGLDAQPGVVAALNTVIETPAPPAEDAAESTKPDLRVPVRVADQARTQAVPPLASEQYGAQQWGLPAIGAEVAWGITRGTGITLAVIDTGVDATHPDLAGRVLPQIDLVGDGRVGDPNGHGTHVAGIAGAALDGAGVAGLANRVRVLPVRVMNPAGSGDTATITQGIVAAVDAGATVINLSLGGPVRDDVQAAAIGYAVSKGVTVLAAVGNSYMNGNPIMYPAAYEGVLGVSSVNMQGKSSGFANAGQHVDISAPGEVILSTIPGGGWGYKDGTSMATPFAAAAAALVRVANPTLSKADVDNVLLGTALDDASGNGPDTWFGYGILQADKAVLVAAKAPGGLSPAAKVSVAKAGYGNVLAVDVDPNLGSGYWTFKVQKRGRTGAWTTLSTTYRTEGAAETRAITLGAGTYRVVVAARHGFTAATSKTVTLTAPTVKVRVSTDTAKDKLRVDVDPSKGSGYWTFKVQKRTSSGRWSTLSTSYRTEGSAETRTVQLPKGTYRVVVAAKYNYRGATSAAVTLNR